MRYITFFCFSTFALTLGLCVIAHTVSAQQTDSSHTWKQSRMELSVGYGHATFATLVEGVNAGQDGYSARPVSQYSGTFSLNFRYRISRGTYIGVGIAYENESGTMQELVGTSDNGGITAPTGTFKRRVYSIAPEFAWLYSHECAKVVQTYGYVGVGYSYLNEINTYSPTYYNLNYNNGINNLGYSREISNDHKEITAQFCAVGISIGDTICGFGEIGFGYKGIINGGVAVKF